MLPTHAWLSYSWQDGTPQISTPYFKALYVISLSFVPNQPGWLLPGATCGQHKAALRLLQNFLPWIVSYRRDFASGSLPMYFTRTAASLCVITLAACGEATPPPPPDKAELTRRLDASRNLTPEARVNVYCEDRVSNLCTKLRDEPSYRDAWLTTMDKLADAQCSPSGPTGRFDLIA